MYVYRGQGFWGSMPPVVKNLVILNSIMLLITFLTGDFMYEKFALFYFESPLFKPYQLVTHMFMHGNFVHLFFNMYSLVIFGIVLEQVWGSKKFFIYYMVTGLGAAALHSLVLWLEVSSLEGAYQAGNMMAATGIENLMRTPDSRCFRSRLRSTACIRNVIPEQRSPVAIPSGCTQSKMVCTHIRSNRTLPRNIQHRQQHCSLCTPRRYAVRIHPHSLLEEEKQNVLLKTDDGEKEKKVTMANFISAPPDCCFWRLQLC